MRVAVVGAGIVGLSAARFLAKRGHQVSLYEQFPLFHDHGSSHGRTRIVRRAYPDAFYTACMTEAYPLWGELEAECGQELVTECGLLYTGGRDAERVTSMVTALEELQVPHEVLGARESRLRFPQMHLESDEVGVFTPEAGWVDAESALRATYEAGVRNGLEVYEGVRGEVPVLAAEYDAVVVAAGAWIKELVDLDVRVTLQTFGYLPQQVEGPVWIDDVTLTYGFPSDDLGQKVGAHLPGPEIDPNEPHRAPWLPHLDDIAEVARRRFGMEKPDIRHVTTCLYTSTASEDFRIGRLADNVLFASACSGHGFKLGPWVGRLLADMVEGKDAPENHPRFCWPA